MKLRKRFHMVLVGKLEEHSIREVCQGAAGYVATRPDLDFEPWTVYPGGKFAASLEKLNHADGLLVCEKDLSSFRGLREHVRVPHVLFLANDRRGSTPVVRLDEAAIGKIAAEHLIHRGYRQLAFFGCGTLPWSIQRGAGFLEATATAGLTVAPFAFPPATLPAYLYGRLAQRRHGLYQALRTLPRPCGVFAANDVLACYTIAAARALGLRVPEQVAVVGVDDDPIANAAAGLAISTVQTPFRQMGRYAAEILDRLRRGQTVARDTTLPPVRVVVRISTNAFMAQDHLLARAQAYIEERRNKSLHVREMVRDLCTTTVTVHKHFFEYLKITPGAYIRQRRMEYAKELLRAGELSVKQVCYACGFDDYSYFCHTFRRATGVTPGSLRAAKPT